MTGNQILIYLAIIYKGDWDMIYEVLDKRRPIDYKEGERIITSFSHKAITIMDSEYPEELKKIFKPPFVLFYEGDISLLNNISKNIAIVGSRKAETIYLDALREIVHDLKPGINVVSGLASGVDAMAHQAAIESGRKTIAVLGCGIDLCFPTENHKIYHEIKKNHLLLSEFPHGTPPYAMNFPKRNRIVAGLSKTIFVPMATKKSGSMITVSCGLEQGKDILCLPSVDFNNSACNLCIKSGAYLVENADDINEFYNH